MTADRARQISKALTSDIGDEYEIGVHAYPDGDYNDEITVEIARGLLELAQMKEAVAKEKKELEEKPWCVSYWHMHGSLEEIEDAGQVSELPN